MHRLDENRRASRIFECPAQLADAGRQDVFDDHGARPHRSQELILRNELPRMRDKMGEHSMRLAGEAYRRRATPQPPLHPIEAISAEHVVAGAPHAAQCSEMACNAVSAVADLSEILQNFRRTAVPCAAYTPEHYGQPAA
jgi:hypothetical protein